MRCLILAGLGALTVVIVASPSAMAQSTNGHRPLTLTVHPRSFLDPGTAAPVGSLNRYAIVGQDSLRTSPPWSNNDRFDENLPRGPGEPFIGAANPFQDIDTTGSIP